MRTVRFRVWETLQYNHLVPRGVGRFQVMATLQAARAQVLGLPLASAKSWGLNRAIYYAAAKRGFKGGSGPAKPEKYQRSFGEYWLGLDKAYKVRAGGRMLFTIGGDIQHPEDFKRQIEERFQGTFRQAWKESREILQRYKREALESPEHFYQQVYRPRRDELAARWNERAASKSEAAS